MLLHSAWMNVELLQKNGLSHRSRRAINRRRTKLGVKPVRDEAVTIPVRVQICQEHDEKMAWMIEDGEDGPRRQDIIRRALGAYLRDVEIP